jgi:hypothetical protein
MWHSVLIAIGRGRAKQQPHEPRIQQDPTTTCSIVALDFVIDCDNSSSVEVLESSSNETPPSAYIHNICKKE